MEKTCIVGAAKKITHQASYSEPAPGTSRASDKQGIIYKFNTHITNDFRLLIC